MEKEVAFAVTLEKLKGLAKEQGYIVSTQQVKEIFDEWDLDETQYGFIYDYLKKEKIGVDEKVNLDDYLSDEEKDYLALYLEELHQLPERTSGEKEAITLAAMAGDVNAKKDLIEIYLPKVVEIAKLYAGQGIFMEDLIGEGNVAITLGIEMLGCLENPDEAEGLLGKMIMDAMEEFLAGREEVAESDQKVLDRINEIADKANEMAKLLASKVTVAQLAEELSFTEDEIVEAIRIAGNRIDSIEEIENGNDE